MVREPNRVTRREAMRLGRSAALDALMAKEDRPDPPFRKGTKSRMWWEHGAERTERLFSQIMDIGR